MQGLIDLGAYRLLSLWNRSPSDVIIQITFCQVVGSNDGRGQMKRSARASVGTQCTNTDQ
eukprot:6423137-Karenia_brevis.AAC.1